MQRQATQVNWLDYFPANINVLSEQDSHDLLTQAQRVHLDSGEVLFHDGNSCANFVVICEGWLKVQKVFHDGHEITLDRVGPGQVCEITTSCILANHAYPAEGIAETPLTALLLPRQSFLGLFSRSAPFRDYVFRALENGTHTLLKLLENVAFVAVDLRLSRALVNHADQNGMLRCTHQSLAAELGTAREVVSRILKRFEHDGWVKLYRGRIEITNQAALQALISKPNT